MSSHPHPPQTDRSTDASPRCRRLVRATGSLVAGALLATAAGVALPSSATAAPVLQRHVVPKTYGPYVPLTTTSASTTTTTTTTTTTAATAATTTVKRRPSRMGSVPRPVSPTTPPAPAPTTDTTVGVPVDSSFVQVGTLGYDRAALSALPMSGSAWTALKAVADGPLGTVDLVDQDSKTAGRTFGAALVYARTADPVYRTKVVAQLRALPTASLTGARVLSVGRQLAGYVAAADLVGYRDPAFVSWVGRMRTLDLGNHARWRTLSHTSGDAANNWGGWALASRIAASLYVGDRTDVAASARIFRGFLGDRGAYAGFRPTADFDPGWVCGDPATWVPVNPAGCGARDGALVEDISRSAGVAPATDDVGRTYSWELLGGATLSAELLSRNGYGDVYEWSDRALLRAASFLARNGGYAPKYSVNQYIPWNIQRAYGVDLGPVNPAGLGRQYGFTDWLR